MLKIEIDKEIYLLSLFNKNLHSQETLNAEKEKVLQLFLEREKEFTFNPSIIVEYPNINEVTNSLFLNEPITYIKEKITAIRNSGELVSNVVILTTFGDRLLDPLGRNSYMYEKINMPAGPANTFKFYYKIPGIDLLHGKTLYFEAVNENDEKINPTFVMKLSGLDNKFCGGVYGSISKQGTELFAYVATMVIKKGLPKLTGTRLMNEMLNYLKLIGIKKVNLGTQTAVNFYEKQGFIIIHKILTKLRTRISNNNEIINNDLVIMEKVL